MLFLPGLAHLTLVCASSATRRTPRRSTTCCGRIAGRVVIVGAPAQACWGPVDHYLGILAALAGRPEWAADHFEAALPPAPGSARRRCSPRRASSSASSAVERRTASDRDRAMALLDASPVARPTRSTCAAASIVSQRRRSTPQRAAIGSADEHPVRARRRRRPSGRRRCTLRRDGEFWTVITPRGSTHVRDAKGVRHLATLLAQPGRPVHVLDLAAGQRRGQRRR